MKLRRQKGFTLIEVIVVAAIIAVLAGILVPLIFKEIDEAKISRAAADVRSISSAIFIMKKDTGQWPNKDASCNAAVTFLYGAGVFPGNLDIQEFDRSASYSLDGYLSSDANGCYGPNWKGPYMAIVNADPWGNMYVINAPNFIGNGPVWILSAGPNGTVETDANAATLGGDDIGVRLK